MVIDQFERFKCVLYETQKPNKVLNLSPGYMILNTCDIPLNDFDSRGVSG